jgi:YggT family protein
MAILRAIIGVYILVLLVRVVLSWVNPDQIRGALGQLQYICELLTEPLLRPIRRVLPMLRVGGVGIDMSTFVLMIILGLIQRSL